jgi:hypothetical protein
MKARKFIVIAPIMALALAVGGVAYAGNGGFGGPHNGAHGYGPRGKLSWGFGSDAAPYGMVTSLVGTTLTILDFDGTTVTYTVGSATKYYLNGKPGTSGSVSGGENVVVYAGRPASTSAQIVFLFSPHAFGAVQSVTPNSTGDLIVVQDPQGFWHPIQTDSSTIYYANGTHSTTAPTFTDGEILSALGSVAADHETVDATQVNVVTLHSHH